jgi:multidrug efflux pump subunit AcrA (membrane-fusion protein)
MSAAVEIVLARHEDVLTIPTNACLEIQGEFICWVKTRSGVERRVVELGDSSSMFILVESGLNEGEQVILDPLANVPGAQKEAAASLRGSREQEFGFEDL